MTIKDIWRLIPLGCFIGLFVMVEYQHTSFDSGLISIDDMVPAQVSFAGASLLGFSILLGQTLFEVIRHRKQQIIVNCIVMLLCIGAWAGTMALKPAVLFAA